MLLSILLTILKIIGIILLCILGLLLFIILVILFVPVRYKAEGEYKDKNPYVKAKITYLLHIISVTVCYKDKFDLSIRIFGIKLFNKDKKKRKRKNTKKSDVIKNESKADSHLEENFKSENATLEDKDSKQDSFALDNNSKEAVKKDSDTKKKVKEKNIDKTDKEETEKKSFIEKISGLKNNVEYWKDLLTDDSTKRAFEVCKHRIGMLLKSILPRKGYFNMWIGLEDAGKTGKLYGTYWTFYRYIGKVVHFYPQFDKKQLDVEFKLKGKIVLFSILIQIIKIYFNKDCKRLIKILINKSKE